MRHSRLRLCSKAGRAAAPAEEDFSAGVATDAQACLNCVFPRQGKNQFSMAGSKPAGNARSLG